MATVDLQQLGRMAEAVERNSKAVENLGKTLVKHAEKMETGFEKAHKRIDDHMEKEEAERKEMLAVIKSVADASKASDVKMNDRLSKLEWRLGLIAAALGAGGSALGPVISKMVANNFLRDATEFAFTLLQ